MEVTFRPLAEDDLALLHGWLNEPGVVAWWEGDDVSWEGVVRDHWSEPDAYVEHWISVDPTWTQACASPYEANRASWRALARAGFTHRGTFTDDDGPCRLMVIDRPTELDALAP